MGRLSPWVGSWKNVAESVASGMRKPCPANLQSGGNGVDPGHVTNPTCTIGTIVA